jgi:hypothetical protein
MSNLDLVLDDVTFQVQRAHLSEFLKSHPELADQQTYVVQSRIPRGIFSSFVQLLKNGSQIAVTPGNVGLLSLLADEFCCADLQREYMLASHEFVAKLAERLRELEQEASFLRDSRSSKAMVISAFVLVLVANLAVMGAASLFLWRNVQGLLAAEHQDVEDKVSALAGTVQQDLTALEQTVHDELRVVQEGVESKIVAVQTSIQGRLTIVEQTVEKLTTLEASVQNDLTLVTKTVQEKLMPKVRVPVQCPFASSGPLNGIVAYLTRKYGGNVHRSRLVTIVGSSLIADATRLYPHHVADFHNEAFFQSSDTPGQWLRWDFHKMRVSVSHYTLRSHELKTWRLEVSTDGQNWTQVDRHVNDQRFREPPGPTTERISTFSIAHPVECRFIRLTQEARNHRDNNFLVFSAVEFFGTVFE